MTARREVFYVELGRRIAQLRHQRGLSQQELGARMNPQMTRASFANIENGQQRVLAHTLVQLASVLETSVDALVGTASTPDPDAADVQRELGRKLPKSVVSELSRNLGLIPRKPRRKR